ncbi:IS21-like element helper ATPase IstB [Streptomyces sp. NBC_01619]|nr:IS21-like element helper ATPase IstB [Streptomyces sp. NBC_01619]MCX4515773.1 IS21-like element helper ATPase IstB [Streptomyces sp. NBC_01619]
MSTPTTRSRRPAQVTGPAGDALDEAIELTRRLRLPHLRKQLTELIPTARAQRWDPAELVRVLLAEEAAGRDAAMLAARRKKAGFPAGKTFDVWDEKKSSIPPTTQSALRSLEWVTRRENFCVVGPSGTGKSHWCEALGHAVVEAGMTTCWFTIEDLGVLVRRHRADDSMTKAMQKIMRADLVIVDDIGLLPVSVDAAEGFYRLVDAAYEKRSLAVSSNLHPAGFEEIMPKTLATATVDRLLHHAHVVVTQGDSFRLTQATAGEGVIALK